MMQLGTRSGSRAVQGPAAASSRTARRAPRPLCASSAAAGGDCGPEAASAAPLLDQALRAQLSTRWLPYDGAVAVKAVAMAHAIAPGRRTALAFTLPVYTALLASRFTGTYDHPPPPHAPLQAAAAAAASDLEAAKAAAIHEVRSDKRRLAATVRMLMDERSRCERDLLGSDLSAWRRSNLEAQAEALSNDIYALERLLRISDAAPTIEGWS